MKILMQDSWFERDLSLIAWYCRRRPRARKRATSIETSREIPFQEIL